MCSMSRLEVPKSCFLNLPPDSFLNPNVLNLTISAYFCGIPWVGITTVGWSNGHFFSCLFLRSLLLYPTKHNFVIFPPSPWYPSTDRRNVIDDGDDSDDDVDHTKDDPNEKKIQREFVFWIFFFFFCRSVSRTHAHAHVHASAHAHARTHTHTNGWPFCIDRSPAGLA